MSGFEIPLPVVALGLITGMTYGLLAVGVVLIYRTNRIINFAQGEIGAFAAAIFGLGASQWGLPYYLNLVLALAVGAATGIAAEVLVIRRLRNAPRIMSIVATLGVGQFLLAFGVAVNRTGTAGAIFPQPAGMPIFNLGALRVGQAYSGMLFLSPLVVAAITLFLRYSRQGLALRASAANPDAARMSGISAPRMSSLAWGIAGALSTFTAILVVPTTGIATAANFGPGLLLRALVGAVLARMVSLPIALAGGVAMGVIEQVLLWNSPRGGYVEVALFLIILVALLVQRGLGTREEEKGSWAAVQGWRPLPEAAKAIWYLRHSGWIVGAVAFGVLAVIPVFASNSTSAGLTSIISLAAVGLSVGIVTGLGGQLSLGQFSIAAVGAVVSFQIARRTGIFPLAFLGAGVAGAAASMVVGVPALRVRGILLTVTTLSFGLVLSSWGLLQPWSLAGETGTGVDPGRPIIGGIALDTSRQYYPFCLAVLFLLVLLAANIRRAGFARLLIAVRDNEDNARAFTVPARRVKLQAFVLAGFIAGVGGAAYGHSLSRISFATFPVTASLDVVVLTVIGGLGLLAGPLLGAAFVLGIPQFLPLDSAGLAASRLGLLVLILYWPGGIASLLAPLRDRVVGRLVRKIPAEDEIVAGPLPARVRRDLGVQPDRTPAPSGPLLAASEIEKRFGGLAALGGVSLEVAAQETVGIIGPNGAGKTTLFEILGGFTKADRGAVVLDGVDITAKTPEERGRLGLIRSFQDAALFPTMSVTESVALSLERVSPTSFWLAAAGWSRPDRKKVSEAREIVGAMGLWAYRDKQVHELSTGTRRICELACLVALQPRVLLLDEPSSGIAQRETEALGALVAELRRELDLTLVAIEHDMPLIAGLADRLVAMDAGQVIATGPPTEVLEHPAVVEAYLGGRIEAIERSGRVGPRKSGRKPAEKAPPQKAPPSRSATKAAKKAAVKKAAAKKAAVKKALGKKAAGRKGVAKRVGRANKRPR